MEYKARENSYGVQVDRSLRMWRPSYLPSQAQAWRKIHHALHIASGWQLAPSSVWTKSKARRVLCQTVCLATQVLRLVMPLCRATSSVGGCAHVASHAYLGPISVVPFARWYSSCWMLSNPGVWTSGASGTKAVEVAVAEESSNANRASMTKTSGAKLLY